MPTLLMRFDAPLQSWGTQSHFTHRDSGLEPSKSGVVGVLGAALGRPRSADFSDLAALRLGVRVVREGQVRRDYQTSGQGGYYQVNGKIERTSVIPSERFYLADALFLVGVAGQDEALLSQLQAALADPVWPIFFGRKAFMPAAPLWLPDGLVEADLEEALRGYAWPEGQRVSPSARLVLEDPQGSVIRHDQPISFAPRRFVARRVRIASLRQAQEA